MYDRNSYLKHRAKKIAAARLYYRNNAEKQNEYKRMYYKKYPELQAIRGVCSQLVKNLKFFSKAEELNNDPIFINNNLSIYI